MNTIFRIIKRVKGKYHRHTIRYLVIDGPFVRGRGLHEGMSTIDGSPIVFFCDVDMLFTPTTVSKIRFHTRPGAVYFPIFFSIYAPKCQPEQKGGF